VVGCGACGAVLAPPASQPAPSASEPASAERRQLTVLFRDLVDSTRLAAGMDAEDWRALVSRYHAAAGEVVARFEGYVAQYLGDGLLAYFGWPKAHEDDAERAVRAGLGIVQAVGALGSGLSVRIRIHTGPVVVGEIGGSARRETLAMGDTTNLAARLQGIAEPNTVVMSAAAPPAYGSRRAYPLARPLARFPPRRREAASLGCRAPAQRSAYGSPMPAR
jgi:class 3 adenylate cyclase